MDRQSVVLSAALFVLLALTGFYAGFLMDDRAEQGSKGLYFEANSTSEIVTATFDNGSVDLMYEDRPEARMYLDTNRDGSADREIDVIHDGMYHNTTELVQINDTGYLLHLRYRDWSNRTSDGEIALVKAERT